jgi:hypothetical protein
MIHNLQLSREDPIIHLKAYGGVEITGVDQAGVACEIEAPQLATLVEEDGHVYVTVNSSCRMTVPTGASFEIEKGMGSVKISNIHNKIDAEKVLGNLVLSGVGEVLVGKVGGNFSVKGAAGAVQVEKVGGNLVLSDMTSFKGEKIGGSCKAKAVHGEFSLEKIGGSFKGQDIDGALHLERVGGSFSGRRMILASELHVGGDLRLEDFTLAPDYLEFKAGGDIQLEISEEFQDAKIEMRSGSRNIRINVGEDDLDIRDGQYEYAVRGTGKTLVLAAGGSIVLRNLTDPQEDIVGDLSDHFEFEESPFNELIRERVDSATRRAEAKVKATEIRLGQIRERVEKHRGFDIHVDLGGLERPVPPVPPVPPISRRAGKKGPSDEERLMILKMLQDKKITVEEAETLFNALED